MCDDCRYDFTAADGQSALSNVPFNAGDINMFCFCCSKKRFLPHNQFASLCIAILAAVATATAVSGPPVIAGEPLKTIKDFGAHGDGKIDDTAAIQKAVDSGIGDIFLPRGVYRISKPIVVELDKVGFTSIRGSGAATIVMAGPGPALKIVGTHLGTAEPPLVKPNVYKKQRSPIVEGLEIVGEHPQSLGIEAVCTFKLIIDKVTIRETLHAIRLATHNRNVIISDCHLYNNRGVGLYLDKCDFAPNQRHR